VLYRVRAGDTLYQLAQQFGTTVQRLVQLNELEDPNMLEVGQLLLVPDREGGRIEFRPKNFDYEIVDNILLVLFTERDSYQRGEPVDLNLVKVNIGNSIVNLNYTTGQRVDFRAFQDGNRLWTWSAGRFFTQETRRIGLEPQRSMVYRKTWPQITGDDQQVEPGIYRLTGWNVAQELNEEKLGISVEIR
jgi:LysM repeat protein